MSKAQTIEDSVIKSLSATIADLKEWKSRAQDKLIELAARPVLNWIEIDKNTKVPEDGFYVLMGRQHSNIWHQTGGDIFSDTSIYTHAALIRDPTC